MSQLTFRENIEYLRDNEVPEEMDLLINQMIYNSSKLLYEVKFEDDRFDGLSGELLDNLFIDIFKVMRYNELDIYEFFDDFEVYEHSDNDVSYNNFRSNVFNFLDMLINNTDLVGDELMFGFVDIILSTKDFSDWKNKYVLNILDLLRPEEYDDEEMMHVEID